MQQSVSSRGVVRGWRKGSEALLSASGPATRSGATWNDPGSMARANKCKGLLEEDYWVPPAALVPTGTGWGEKGRRLRDELPPLAGSRHVAAAPLRTAGKVQREPGSRRRGEKVRRNLPPASESASPTPDNGSELVSTLTSRS